MISFIVSLMGDDFCKWAPSEDVLGVLGHDKGLRAEHPTFGHISSLKSEEMSEQMSTL